MVAVRFALGAEADLASGDELKVMGEDIKAHFDKAGRLVGEQRPIRRKAVGSLTSPGTAPFVIELVPQGPSVGRLWEITQVIALGSDDHTALAGVTVSWYLSDPANQDLTDVFYPGMAVVGEQHFSRGVVWQHPQVHLFGSVNGATAGQSITLIARMSDYSDDSSQPRGV